MGGRKGCRDEECEKAFLWVSEMRLMRGDLNMNIKKFIYIYIFL